MHTGLPQTSEWLRQVVRGYFQYHAVSGNWERLKAFRREVLYSWYQALRRRSQRTRLRWSTFPQRFGALLAPVQILQPYPNLRFDAKYHSIQGKNRVR